LHITGVTAFVDPAPLGTMKKILIVDDDPDTRHIWQTALEFSGFTCVAATDGPDGIVKARTENPDLIVMNLSMPKLDGISATMLLRRDPATSAIPIIACTGYVKEDGGEEAEDAGVDAYLEKPCEPSRMVEEVERFLGPAKSVAAD
jgi:two-component system, cell cycle response regulator DivK